MFMPCLTYLSSIDLAWQKEPTHTRISPESISLLQASRADLELFKTLPVDPNASIVTLIIDCVTDRNHFHLVKEAAESQIDRWTAAARAAVEEEDEVVGGVSADEVAAATAKLAGRRVKDAVPVDVVASCIAPLADKCASLGKELHILLTGCNTISLVAPLKKRIADSSHACVWVMCTTEVWPTDVATFMWHLYGGLVRKGDMLEFRAGTRDLLGEYTDHFVRQHIVDQSLSDAGLEVSLANAIRLDRLDRVEIVPGMLPDMAML